MCFSGVIRHGRLRVLGLAALLVLAGIPAAAADTMVYTALVDGGAALSDEALIAIAQEMGAAESLHFQAGGALERRILRLGAPGVGCPGFTSMSRVDYEMKRGAAKTVQQSDGSREAVLEEGALKTVWRAPRSVGAAPFETVVFLNGEELYVERRLEEKTAAGVQPTVIRIDFATGSSIIQVFDRGAAAVAPADDTPLGPTPETTLEPAAVSAWGDPAKAAQNQLVQFTAPAQGFNVGMDSGWWPGGGTEEPGGFVLQVRLRAVGAYTYMGNVQGYFWLVDEILKPGAAAGSWGYDFGAELFTKAAIDLGFIGINPIQFDIPYIPNFDLRTTAYDTFETYLLDSVSTLHDVTPRRNLFSVDIVPLILGQVDIPDWLSWIPLSGGASVDVSIAADGAMTCDAIRVTDGCIFTEEGQEIDVIVPEEGYQELATYDENAELTITLDFFPALYIKVFSMRFDLPLFTIPWAPYEGPLDLPFNDAELNFSGTPSQGDVTDWFTERFIVNNDLSYKRIQFIPSMTSNRYTACIDPATAYGTDPAGHTPLPLGDDAFAEITLSGGKSVWLYGVEYDTFYVGSNGYITFTEGDTAKSETYDNHFRLPRVSGMFDDLKPQDGGEISWAQLPDRVVVTWDQV
ncbi:MAG TPA: hypothetical protein ENN65_05890, partial [Candidatus Hydrogenedentes bacterium]|nr:hypothetical protein [Candidatus Hydrogenedentota bacterium]